MAEMKLIINLATKYYGINSSLFTKIDESIQIVFLINFPVVSSETFTSYHLYSKPIQNSFMVTPKNMLLIMNKNFIQYASLPCVDLYQTTTAPTKT